MYMIYCKAPNEKLSRPLDMEHGRQVINLLFATLYRSKDRAEEIASHLREDNPTYTFSVRRK
jgi:hypothetical protein